MIFRTVPKRDICKSRYWYSVVSYIVQKPDNDQIINYLDQKKSCGWGTGHLQALCHVSGQETMLVLGLFDNLSPLPWAAWSWCHQVFSKGAGWISVLLHLLWSSVVIPFIPPQQMFVDPFNEYVACISINCSKHPHKDSKSERYWMLFEPEQWHMDFFNMFYPYFPFSGFSC